MCIEDHMDTLVNNIFGMVSQELEDVLDLSLVRKAAESDAVLAGARSDHLLGYHSHRRHGG